MPPPMTEYASEAKYTLPPPITIVSGAGACVHSVTGVPPPVLTALTTALADGSLQ